MSLIQRGRPALAVQPPIQRASDPISPYRAILCATPPYPTLHSVPRQLTCKPSHVHVNPRLSFCSASMSRLSFPSLSPLHFQQAMRPTCAGSPAAASLLLPAFLHLTCASLLASLNHCPSLLCNHRPSVGLGAMARTVTSSVMPQSNVQRTSEMLPAAPASSR